MPIENHLLTPGAVAIVNTPAITLGVWIARTIQKGTVVIVMNYGNNIVEVLDCDGLTGWIMPYHLSTPPQYFEIYA
jgi:hypothetical protein